VVAWFNGGYALTNGFNDASTFMAKDNGEGAFGVFAGEGIRIC